MFSRGSIVSILLCFALFVGACGDDHRVPFAGEESDSPEENTETDPEAPFEGTEGQLLPDDTTEVQVEGAPLSYRDHLFEVLLPLDVNGDGERDAFVTTAGEGEVSAVVGVRHEGGFQTRRLGRFAVPEGCISEGGAARTLSANLALLTGGLRCGEFRGAVHWLVSVEEEPRLRESIALYPDAFSAEATFATRDLDDDGHEDVLATITLRPRGQEPLSVEMHWLDRAGGLARTPEEPLGTLERTVEAGRAAALGTPPAALARAEQLEALHHVFCRHPESTLQLGTSRGVLRCPPWAATAAAIRAAALVAEGRPVAEALRDVDPTSLGDDDRQLVERALDGRTRRRLVQRRVHELRMEADDTASHLLLAFRGDALAIRDQPPVQIAADPAAPPIPDAGLAPIRDPNDNLSVFRVRRTCAGVVADLLPADRLGTGMIFERPVASPLIAIEGDEDCTEGEASEAARWRVLGWAPQGLVVALDGRRSLVTLQEDGSAAGRPQPLSGPVPAPLEGGRITPNGDVWIEETPFGVLYHGPSGDELWRPEGWSELDEPPLAAAVSADGERVAVLRGRSVWVIEAPAEDEEPPQRPARNEGDDAQPSAPAEAAGGEAGSDETGPAEAASEQAAAPPEVAPEAPTEANPSAAPAAPTAEE